ncbi:MAG: glycosyltransferase [Phycisphaerales bacterium]|nr:glycosyltransferase [Phycisphaerales bacterium]
MDIYAVHVGDQARVHPDVIEYKLQQRTTYLKMPENRAVRLLKGIGMFLLNLRNPAVILRSLNVFRYGVQASSLMLLYTVAAIKRPRVYDIIHCQFGPLGIRGMFLRDSGLLSGKLITQFRGSDLNAYPRQRLAGSDVYRKLFEEGDLFLALSSFLIEKAVELGCPKHKILKLPLGVDLSKFVFTERRLEPDSEIRLLSIGRLLEVKGIEYAVRAVAKVSARFPNLRYRVIGEGPLLEPLKTLAHELGISRRVEFLGGLIHDQVLRHYDESHILLHPGVVAQDGAEEGLGTVLVEAQAAGLPVIASKVGGIPECVRDGESGHLVPQRDVDALASKLCDLIEHSERWPEMGRIGRKNVEAHFDNRKLCDGLVEIYENLCHLSSAK